MDPDTREKKLAEAEEKRADDDMEAKAEIGKNTNELAERRRQDAQKEAEDAAEAAEKANEERYG